MKFKEEMREFNGIGLTNLYNGDLFSMLFEVYPEINWFFMEKHKSFLEITGNFWNSFEIKRKFLDKFSHQFQIKTQKDWKYVTKKQMMECDDFLFSILTEIYPDI